MIHTSSENRENVRCAALSVKDCYTERKHFGREV